jgi:hypothetical protein
MKINMKRVLIGGLVAGLIIIASAVVMVPVVGKEMELALAACNLPPMGTGAMAYFGIVSLVLGIVLVWLYAAILPRMGHGIKTALIASAVVWFLAYFLANVSMVAYGFMPTKLTAIGTIWGLVELLVGGVVGTRLYKD